MRARADTNHIPAFLVLRSLNIGLVICFLTHFCGDFQYRTAVVLWKRACRSLGVGGDPECEDHPHVKRREISPHVCTTRRQVSWIPGRKHPSFQYTTYFTPVKVTIVLYSGQLSVVSHSRLHPTRTEGGDSVLRPRSILKGKARKNGGN